MGWSRIIATASLSIVASVLIAQGAWAQKNVEDVSAQNPADPSSLSRQSVAFANSESSNRSPEPAGSPIPASSALTPQLLLLKMAQASRTTPYIGTFTYQQQDQAALQSFRVLHYSHNDEFIERLQFLNGPAREVVRNSRRDDCPIVASDTRPDRFIALGERLSQLTQFYRFEVKGVERVAGRSATMLMALPLDPYRYSYYFSIDNETGLILRSWLVDDNARALERYQFVELHPHPSASDIAAIPQAPRRLTADQPCQVASREGALPLRLEWLPAGFTYLGSREARAGVQMAMYSDGLSGFSVFVEAAAKPHPEGIAQRGATLAAMRNLAAAEGLYRVSVVGEIPVVSAQKILQNVALIARLQRDLSGED